MPGGVSSPVRAFGAVGGNPVFLSCGKGPYVVDVDGREYIDLLGSWGPLILGHAHPAVVEAIKHAVEKGASFGAPIEPEIELAELIIDALPAVEMVRFVSSGTEAAMSALRLARAATGREKFLKFEGCYHGHFDAFLTAAGSAAVTLGLPDSPGVTEGVRKDTVLAPYNSPAAVDEAFDKFGPELAAVIVEPIAANMGVVPPQAGFLEALRRHCTKAGALLVFDEVVTGFRVGRAGAQGMFGVVPDLTILGKVIGGGLPVAAYGGGREIMELVAPSGSVYQAGTLSGNPIGMAAGVATLKLLVSGEADPYPGLDKLGGLMQEGLEGAAKESGVALRVQRMGSMFTAFFSGDPVTNLGQARSCDTASFGRFFHQMLDAGVYWPPSQFESAFISAAHSAEHIDKVASAAVHAFAGLAEDSP